MWSRGGGVLDRVFGRKEDAAATTLSTLDKLNGTLELLEKREKLLQRKIDDEIKRAKEFSRLKNKRAAIQALKKKKMYELQLEQTGNYQLRIHDQMVMLEGAKATTDTIVALKEAANVMSHMQKTTNITNIDKTLDEINDQSDRMREVNEALGRFTEEYDEDELEQELEELEGEQLEEELVAPTNVPLPVQGPAQPAQTAQPPPRQTAAAPQQKKTVDDELAALQAEMAL